MDPTLWPPVGLDRADGSQSIDGMTIGTPTPSGTISVSGSAGGLFFEEDPDSPEIERGEQCTARHTFQCDPTSAQVILQSFGRGTVVMDTANNVWKILTCTSQRLRADRCRIIMVQEGISFDTPPDQFRIEAVELNPDLMKHPRYAFLTGQERSQAGSAAGAISFTSFQQMAGAIQTIPHTAGTWEIEPGNTIHIASTYPEGATDPGAARVYTQSGADNGSSQQHFVAAYELMQRMFIGESTFYLPGFRVQLTQFYWMPVSLDPGGRIQDPILAGGLPFFYWNLDNPQSANTSNTIFTRMAALNPQLYSDNGQASGKTQISWLRLADMPMVWERTWFAVTSTWLGAPYSHWDKFIYSQNPSPYPLPPPDPLSVSAPF